MCRRKRSREDHEALGRELKRANAALVRFICAGSPNDAVSRTAMKLHHLLSETRSRLDDEVCRAFDPKDDTVLTIYYGKPE